MPQRPHSLVRLASVLLLCAGCRPAGGVSTTATGGPVLLVASGDTRGWLVPCGCTSNQSGGLLRRATYIAGLRQHGQVVLVDAGGAPGGTSPYDIVRLEAILRGEVEMGIRAHNIGGPEAALGLDALRELEVKTGIPFISANLVDDKAAHPFAGFQTALCGTLRVTIIGVTSPESAGPGLSAIEPKSAILDVLRRLRDQREQPDRVIALAWLAEEELKELAEQLPEVHAVIGGPTGQAIAPRRVGPTILAAATNKGKFVIELPLGAGSGDALGKVVELGPHFADEEHQTANLKRYLAELAERDLAADETSFVPKKSLGGGDDRVAGSESCRDCHTQEHAAWAQSRHAAAWATLVEKEFHVDPYCQHCHATGYGRPGGFVSAKKSASLGGVGCEDCHGPSSRHVADAAVRTAWQAADRCTACHDHENSPHFEFAEYWRQVAHGREGP